MIKKLQSKIDDIIETGDVPGNDINAKISHILTLKTHLNSVVAWYDDIWFTEYVYYATKKLDIIQESLYATKELPIYKELIKIEIENGR